MSRSRQRRPDLPGNQFVAVDVMCKPCQLAGKRRKLRRFGRDTYPGADRALWVVANHAPDGSRTLPEWTAGPNGVEMAHLMCACGHTPQVYADKIAENLDAVERGDLPGPAFRWPL